MGHDSNTFSKRLVLYFVGLFIMTVGVTVSVKSDLGVTPISSIPYTMTVVSGMDLGVASIIFSVIMVLLQIVVLRKEFSRIDLLQIPIGIVFGMFLTFCGGFLYLFPDPPNFLMQIVLALVSTVLVAIGVLMYVSAGFVPLAPEGLMLAVSRVSGMEFPVVKVINDVTMVLISLVTCLIMVHSLGSVGIGTVIAALLVGTEVRWLRRRFLKPKTPDVPS